MYKSNQAKEKRIKIFFFVISREWNGWKIWRKYVMFGFYISYFCKHKCISASISKILSGAAIFIPCCNVFRKKSSLFCEDHSNHRTFTSVLMMLELNCMFSHMIIRKNQEVLWTAFIQLKRLVTSWKSTSWMNNKSWRKKAEMNRNILHIQFFLLN